MPVTNVKSPDGTIVKVKHPEGASQEEIIAYAKKNHNGKEQAPSFPQDQQITKTQSFVSGMSPLGQIGLEDELYASIAALTNMARGRPAGYEEARQRKLAEQDAAARANPVSHMGGSIAGALGVGAVAPSSGFVNTMKVGALLGGVTAYGKSEKEAAERTFDFLKGSIFGGAASGAAYGVMKGVSLAGKELKNLAFEATDAMTTNIKNKEAISKKAIDRVIKSLEADDVAPSDIEKAMREGVSIFSPEKRSVKRLAQAVAVYPKGGVAAEKHLEPRAYQSFKNIRKELSDMAVEGLELDEIIDDISNAGRDAAAEAYEEAFKVKPRVTPRMQEIMKTKMGKKAFVIGKANYEAEVASGAIPKDGEPFRFMDYIVRGFDEQINALKDPTTGVIRQGDTARSLSALRRSFDDELKSQNKLWRKAKSISGDYKSNTEFAEIGAKFDSPKISVSEITKRLDRATDIEKASMRAGALSKIYRNIELSKSQSGRIKPFKSREEERKLLKIFGASDFKKIKKRVMEEDAWHRAYSDVLKNSLTAGRRTAAQIFDGETKQMLPVITNQGSVTTKVLDFFTRHIKTKFDGLSDETAGEVAEYLLSNNKLRQAEILTALKKRANIGDMGAVDGINIIGGAYDATKQSMKQYFSSLPQASAIGMGSAVTVNSGEQ